MKNQNFESDYLKTCEDDLEILHLTFYNKIDEIEEKFDGINCLNLKCEDLLQENYQNELKKFKNLTELTTRELLELEDLKLGNCNDVDLNLVGLTYQEKRELLLKQIKELKVSKNLGIKVFSNLAKELEFHQLREHEMTVPAMINENLINSYKPHFTQIENDVNKEVQRLEKVFLQQYKRKLKAKLKFDKLNNKMAREIFPRLTQLEQNLIDRSEEMKNIEEEIEESRKKLEEFKEMETEFGLKLKNLEEDHGRIFEGNEQMKNYVMKLKKGVISKERKIENFTKQFNKDLIDVKENSGIHQRIQEIQVEKLQNQINCSKISTICNLKSKDETIKELCKNIKEILEKILKSQETIEKFKKNLKILTECKQ
ncbi:hypothetical protein PVAND_002561 [Polypedilum vanderplanki]|uniref:Uncharacterized protein n=1 Tax=Polypedilum vanderplanki TaxID=319348 RepID=A0A9J6BRD5_POLVA|nr:hypothetical protein PVAND_002561 [Polypedilum vanderplanki]